MNFSKYAGLYDVLIEKDNFWRQINEMVDLSFIYDEICKNYSTSMGKSAEDPIKMFK